MDSYSLLVLTNDEDLVYGNPHAELHSPLECGFLKVYDFMTVSLVSIWWFMTS